MKIEKREPKYVKEVEEFSTSDLGCAAALVSFGLNLLYVDKENPKRVEFIFVHKNNINVLINKFWMGKLKIDARTMFENTKMLKNRIYND